MKDEIPFISFIIPVYNEEENIDRMLTNFYRVLEAHSEWDWEVIVIEDGSRDKTREVLMDAIKKYSRAELILHEHNMGWNRSFKDGVRRSRGEYVMYVGADEEFDSTELPNFVNLFRSGEADLVLGVRWQRNAYGLFRFFLSVIYIFFLNGLFKIRINDYNWSQGWSRKVFEAIDMESDSLFVLPEIIIKSHDLGFRIKEIPSNHRGRQWGKSSLSLKIFGHAFLEAIQYFFRRRSRRKKIAADNNQASSS